MGEHRDLLDSTREGEAEKEGEQEEEKDESGKRRKRGERRRGGAGEEGGGRERKIPRPCPLPEEPEMRHKPSSWGSDRNAHTQGTLSWRSDPPEHQAGHCPLGWSPTWTDADDKALNWAW